MSMDEFGTLLRTVNLFAGMLLLSITLAAIFWRWNRMDPIERLFSMSLEGYMLYVTAVTWYGLELEAGFRWYVPVLTVSNIWLIVTVVILTIRKDEPVRVPPAVATSEGWEPHAHESEDRPEPS